MSRIKKFIVMSKDVDYKEEDIKLPERDLFISELYVAVYDYPSPSVRRESRWRAVEVGIQLKLIAYGFFAMALTWGWLLYHKLWSKLFLSLFIFIAVGIVVYSSSLSMPMFYHWLLMQIFWIWTAYKANYWIVRKWYKNGYKVVGVVNAITAEEAVGKYLETRQSALQVS